MRALLLPDLALALPVLLDEKARILGRTLCGQLYRPRLIAKLGAIESLPPLGLTGRPLAEALDEAELLGDTIDLLCDLRAALADELAADPDDLQYVDAELFSLLDELATDREAVVLRRSMATTVVLPASLVSRAAPAE
jgi:hypothetical protein